MFQYFNASLSQESRIKIIFFYLRDGNTSYVIHIWTMSLRLIFVEIELIFAKYVEFLTPKISMFQQMLPHGFRAQLFLALKLIFTHKKHFPGSIFFWAVPLISKYLLQTDRFLGQFQYFLRKHCFLQLNVEKIGRFCMHYRFSAPRNTMVRSVFRYDHAGIPYDHAGTPKASIACISHNS